MLKLMPIKRMNNSLIKKEDIFDHLFDSFFEDFFTPLESMGTKFNSFKVDVLEDSTHYVVEADLPGFKKEDLTIEYENNYLTITARKEEVVEERKEQFIRRERQCGEFRRSFFVENIDREDIDAAFKNGILTVRLKKK